MWRRLLGGGKKGEVDTDFSGTKVYDVNGLKKGTRGQLLDQIGEMSHGYLQMNDPLAGAERFLDMFTLVPNRELLEKSMEVRDVAFGNAQNTGPIQFLIDEAGRRGLDGPGRTRQKALQARLDEMVTAITGEKPEREPVDSRPFPRIYRPTGDGREEGRG